MDVTRFVRYQAGELSIFVHQEVLSAVTSGNRLQFNFGIMGDCEIILQKEETGDFGGQA